VIDRGALTDVVLAHLQAHLQAGEVLVGDGLAPELGGWAREPATGLFRGYTVVVGARLTPRAVPMAAGTPPDFAVEYSMRHYGGSRKQADWVSTAVRTVMATGLVKSVFGIDVFKVIGLEWTTMGGPERDATTDPPLWQVYDTLTLVCSRS
jgi:hypothetical protein